MRFGLWGRIGAGVGESIVVVDLGLFVDGVWVVALSAVRVATIILLSVWFITTTMATAR